MTNISLKQIVLSLAGAAALCFLSWGLTAALINKGIGSAESAAWVQAVGATLGLAIAIWLPYQQKRESTQEEQSRKTENEIRVCQSIQDELWLVANSFNGRHFRELIRQGGTGMFNIELASGDLRFPVFEAMADRLVEIGDADTRRAIIRAYGSADELHNLLALNTRTLHSYNQIILVSRKRIDGNTYAQLPREEDFAKSQLEHLRDQLREVARKVKKDKETALELLENSIERCKTQLF